jgi:Protein of unknown function (DUF1566)
MSNFESIPRAGAILALVVALALTMAAERDALADAPSGHFTVVRGSVEDAVTGLTWQQKLTDKRYNWAEATAACVSLELRGKGWRLPTIKELHTLVDETRVSPSIDPVAFPDTQADYFWTASQLAKFSGDAWAVSFDQGFDNWFDVGTKQRVRCVR